jgi:hypothetical protein
MLPDGAERSWNMICKECLLLVAETHEAIEQCVKVEGGPCGHLCIPVTWLLLWWSFVCACYISFIYFIFVLHSIIMRIVFAHLKLCV